MYGGVGGRYGGIGRPGIMGLDPNDPSSLVNSISESTQATLQIVGNFVSAFGGFAQLLDSAYMTTHSSIIGQLFWTFTSPNFCTRRLIF